MVPRYSITSDVSIVLRFLEAWQDNADISLEQLAWKLVLLFCLVSCKTVSNVWVLN